MSSFVELLRINGVSDIQIPAVTLSTPAKTVSITMIIRVSILQQVIIAISRSQRVSWSGMAEIAQNDAQQEGFPERHAPVTPTTATFMFAGVYIRRSIATSLLNEI